MGRASRLHREAVRAKLEPPFRQRPFQSSVFVRCGKCGELLTEQNKLFHFIKVHGYKVTGKEATS